MLVIFCGMNIARKVFRILHFTELESDSEVEFLSIKDRNKFFKLSVFLKKNTIFKALLKH